MNSTHTLSPLQKKFSPATRDTSRVKFGLRSLSSDERGMSSVEYIILLVVIVAGCVGLWNEIGAKVYSDLEGSNEAIQSVGEPVKD